LWGGGGGDGKGPPTTPISRRAQKLRCGGDPVVRAEVADLRCEERGAHRGHELSPWITTGIVDAVIDNRDANLAVGPPRQPREHEGEGQPAGAEHLRPQSPSSRSESATRPAQ
jgi:hypothetical protein